MRHVAIRFGAAAFAVGLLVGGAAQAASAEKGKEAFVKHGCFQCHGTVGQGSVATSGGRVLYNTQLPIVVPVEGYMFTDAVALEPRNQLREMLRPGPAKHDPRGAPNLAKIHYAVPWGCSADAEGSDAARKLR